MLLHETLQNTPLMVQFTFGFPLQLFPQHRRFTQKETFIQVCALVTYTEFHMQNFPFLQFYTNHKQLQ